MPLVTWKVGSVVEPLEVPEVGRTMFGSGRRLDQDQLT